jgi:hypothetical protein
MDKEELRILRKALQLIQRDLQFIKANEATVEDEDGE